MRSSWVGKLGRYRPDRWWFVPSNSGAALLAGVVMAGALSLIMQARPVFPLLLALAALLILSAVVGMACRPRLRMVRVPPARAVAGTPFDLHAEVINLSCRAAYDLVLRCDRLPSALTTVGPTTSLPRLGPGQSARLKLRLKAHRRGVWDVGAVRAVSGFPGGLFRFVGATQSISITVIPPVIPLESSALPLHRADKGAIAVQDPRPGDGTEYVSSREFRAGDTPRRIDARASARLRRIVIKEFLPERATTLAVVLDAGAPGGSSWQTARCDVLEAVVCLAASTIHAARDARRQVRLYCPGSADRMDQSMPGAGGFGPLFDRLALVEPSLADPFAAILPRLADDRNTLGAAVFILTRWDELRAEVVHTVMDADRPVRVFIVCDDQATAFPPTHGIPPGMSTRMPAQQILRKAMTEP